ncbi:LysE family transporter [Flavobacterium psychrotolerans]|uniref:Lysine transporter LysE n=1 Tax=Flavobacterium psychrotolerans TaxID=2169410 RepID=A0A2U1JKF4_9FLAO|nr:LysE family transporter [Flavobacterium psychrotolerans]PWA05630.1 lysine transporter LysE [Flavobacterium psychrotolerans]
MRFVWPLFFGFFSAAIGIALPGLINMTAAKVSIRDGRDRALLFVTGAIIIIFFQTLSAILFARFIDSRPDVVVLLREVGLAIFIALTIYFLFFAKKPKAKKEEMKMHSKTNRFFLGMLLSALNFFPVPYYVFVTISLSSYRLFSFDRIAIALFLSGVILGSFAVFYYYISFFKRIEAKTDFFFKNMNQIIGAITGIVALITMITVIKYYY